MTDAGKSNKSVDFETTIEKYALENALKYKKAQAKAVMSKVLSERPELRKDAKSLMKSVNSVVKRVNALSHSERANLFDDYEIIKKERTPRGVLPDLPNVNGKVIMRFAPNPSGPLHIGHARTAILNDEYRRKYGGKLILRIEDTDPSRVDLDSYRMIEEDLKWLGVEWDESITQSRRLPIYVDMAQRLLEQGDAYVCDCEEEKFRELKANAKECPCRKNSPEKNLERWDKMKAGEDKSSAVMLKTDIKHKNPALRDFPIMRVIDMEHPLTEKEWGLYPLMNFSVTVDDHFLNLTHVIRGKDHIMNTERQKFIYKYLGWEMPNYIHNGLMSIEDAVLSTSVISRGIKDGTYTGWSDVHLATLRALKKRGIQPVAIRNLMKAIGIAEVDILFDWQTLYAENKKVIEEKANRFFFIPEPEEMWLKGVPKEIKKIKVPLHPDFRARGFREIQLNGRKGGDTIKMFLSKKDTEDIKVEDNIRLKNFANIKIMERRPLMAKFLKDKKLDVRKLQWLPEDVIGCEVISPEGNVAGFAEVGCRNLEHGDIIQFERFGFVRVNSVDERGIICYFAHR